MKDLTLRQAAELWVSSSVDGLRTCVIEALMDYDPENWREITFPVIGSTVYVYDKCDEGEVVGYVERVKKFKIRLRSERICYAKADELEVSFYEPLPMWGTMWSFSDNLDQYWLEERGGLEEMSKCGFRIFKHDFYGCYFGIDGAGYDFYEQHWIPLYLARGLHWHKEDVEK